MPSEITLASVTVTASIQEHNRFYTQSCVITIRRVVKTEYVIVNNTPNSELYFDARNGLTESNAPANTFNFETSVYPDNANNKDLKYVYVQDLIDTQEDPVVILNQDGTVVPNRAGSAYIHVVAKDSFTSSEDYNVYAIIRVTVADGSIENPLHIMSAADVVSMNTEVGLNLHYVLKNTVDMSGVNFNPIGIIENITYGFGGSLVGELDQSTFKPKHSIIGLNLDSNN